MHRSHQNFFGRTIRKLTFAVLLPTLFACVSVAPAPMLTPAELQVIIGAPWAGTLTYLDFSRNKLVTIRSDLIVTAVPGDASSFMFEYLYPDEPNANSKEKVSITNDGKVFRDETVTTRSFTEGDKLKIVTTRTGQDNNRNAQLRFTYLLNARAFSVVKEVRAEGASDYIERNRYSWHR